MDSYQEVRHNIRFFHTCTDGINNGVIFFCDEDYHTANKICAICAYKAGVDILCYAHMNTHSHFVICCESEDKAYAFINDFKRDYSHYLSRTRSEFKALKKIDCIPKEVTDRFYLMNCIAYVLLNPVAAHMVNYAEKYRWSSIETYFSNDSAISIPVCKLGTIKVRNILHTRADLSGSRICIDEDGHVIPSSFVNHRFVEQLFGSRQGLFRSLHFTDSVKEEERYAPVKVSYSYTELVAEAINLAETLYGKRQLSFLTKEEKHGLISPLRKKTKATSRMIEKVLRLKRNEVAGILGEI